MLYKTRYFSILQWIIVNKNSEICRQLPNKNYFARFAIFHALFSSKWMFAISVWTYRTDQNFQLWRIKLRVSTFSKSVIRPLYKTRSWILLCSVCSKLMFYIMIKSYQMIEFYSIYICSVSCINTIMNYHNFRCVQMNLPHSRLIPMLTMRQQLALIRGKLELALLL